MPPSLSASCLRSAAYAGGRGMGSRSRRVVVHVFLIRAGACDRYKLHDARIPHARVCLGRARRSGGTRRRSPPGLWAHRGRVGLVWHRLRAAVLRREARAGLPRSLRCLQSVAWVQRCEADARHARPVADATGPWLSQRHRRRLLAGAVRRVRRQLWTMREEALVAVAVEALRPAAKHLDPRVATRGFYEVNRLDSRVRRRVSRRT